MIVGLATEAKDARLLKSDLLFYKVQPIYYEYCRIQTEPAHVPQILGISRSVS